MRKSRSTRPRVSASRPVGITWGAAAAAGTFPPRETRASVSGITLAIVLAWVCRTDNLSRRSIIRRFSNVPERLSMPAPRFSVAVVVEPDVAPDAPPSRQCDDATRTRWRFTGHAVELHRSEAEGYFLNVTSPEPK